LQERTVGGITVDVCDGGCAGIWFDQHELRKVDEPHEGTGEELLDLTRDPGVRVNPEERRRCPRCGDSVMMRHFFSVKRHVELDECPTCAGFWLDCGELRDIRALYATEEERRRAAEEYFAEVFGDDVRARLLEGDEGVKRIRRFIQTFRFICPSYYIPGKQDWGAF
jgi:Zn-finger nucleic acid-binding protein